MMFGDYFLIPHLEPSVFLGEQDLDCLFEIYLKPLQNETFLTLDEVGGKCVCECVLWLT